MAEKLEIVALVGPESTGKTTLSEELAAHFNGSFVPEFAREYLEKRNGKYSQADLPTIAKGQFELEKKAVSTMKTPVFCDTDVVVIMVWNEFKFGGRNPELEKILSEQPPRKYLLTYPDLPWQDDPLRENPKELKAIFDLYVKTLDGLGAEYTIVRQSGPARMENAIDALNRMNFG